MYHCHFRLYLTGRSCNAFDIIKKTPSLAHFTHIISESDRPDKELAAQADAIIVNCSEMDIHKDLASLLSHKKEQARMIFMSDREQAETLFSDAALQGFCDVWVLPLSDAEVAFRFSKWLEICKLRADFQETSHFLDATINHTPNLIWYKDKNGIHEKVNDSFCQTVNKTKQQVEGQGHAYIWDVEQDDPACIESEREVMCKRQTCVSEEVIQTGDGLKTLTTYKSPLFDLDGSVMGTVGVAIDVTQERAYEKSLLQKNRTLETIFSSIDCGVMRHSMDGTRILSVNRTALRILGYDTLEELAADGFHLIAASVIEEDRERLQTSIRTLKQDGDSVSVEYRVRHKDGELLHVMGNVKILEENGELVYQRFLLDCTAQKLQEKKNARRHMEMIQALSVDFSLVCLVHPDKGTVTPIRNKDGNGGTGNLFDKEILLKDSIETYINEMVHEDDREMMRQATSLETLEKDLLEKNQYYVNYRKCIAGETHYYQMKAVGIQTMDGGLGIVLGFRCVDEEMRREIEQNRLLEAALSQANQANKAKSTFLSNMSHDIRTPMNAIMGFTNLAINHIDNKEQVAEYLQKINSSGNHLLNLINDVLDMSHIESGKIQLDEKPCNLLDIVNDLQNILQESARAKQLTLQIDTSNLTDTDIYCDKLRLNQVLINLLSNAVKYTEPGGLVTMRISELPCASKDYANYDFFIKDSGLGMSQEFIDHIFEPFEREKNTTISGIQGTGLGMAITKNIVELMNGSIQVTSELGVGTEFVVSLRFRLCAEHIEDSLFAKQNPLLSAAGTEQTVKSHMGRVLLVEDVDLNQEIAVAILEDAGFKAEVASNGKEAVDMVTASEPGYYQAVLMDIQMPVMNGYQATRAIRNLDNKELASIPIIAMTANAFEEDKQEALRSGMNNHIAKPFDIPTLIGILENV